MTSQEKYSTKALDAIKNPVSNNAAGISPNHSAPISNRTGTINNSSSSSFNARELLASILEHSSG